MRLDSYNLFVFYPHLLKETAGELISLLVVSFVPRIGDIGERLCQLAEIFTVFLNWRKRL